MVQQSWKSPSKAFSTCFFPGAPLLSLCAFQCRTAGCEYCLLSKLWPFVNWFLLLQLTEACAAVADGTLLGDVIPHHKNMNLVPYSVCCFLRFSAVGWLKSLALPSSPNPFGCSTHLSVASVATPWLYSCFPTGMLSPQTVSRLALFPSPIEIAHPGSAVLALTVTAHHPLLFSHDNQFPGCRLQAVLAFLQHPLLQGPATWAWCSLLPEWCCFCPVSSDYTGPWVDVMLIWLALLSGKCLWPSPRPVGRAREEEWCQHVH